MVESTDHRLLDVLQAAQAKEGCSMKDLTVLAVQNDPFRNDTPAGHRDGEWLAVHLGRLGIGRLHFRGIHYKLIDTIKPNGEPYMNNAKDWIWLQANPGKSARWLGYIDFDRILDERNTAPTMIVRNTEEPRSFITVGIDIELPDPEDFTPQVQLAEFVGRQDFRLALFGEKSSLAQVLVPISQRYGTDLFLPTGELSDTMIHQMARAAAEDGRHTVCLYISDCDPSGHQMSISLSRKLQAFQHGLYPELDIEVRPIALTPDQVREHGLPSSVLKDSEKRAGAWVAAMGVEQTEVDAVPADLLGMIVEDAIAPYYDSTLADRVRRAESEWLEEAQARLEATVDADERDRFLGEAAEQLDEMRAQVEALNNGLRINTSGIDLPEIVLPEPEYHYPEHGLPLFDSRWDYVDQTRRLKAAKAYEDDE
jgi:hypothetical protein